MYTLRPGTEVISYFIPASSRYGELRDPKGTLYPNIYAGQDMGTFNFFEASSIRKIGNKYVTVFSGYSGPEYGMGSSNSTLRYAVADSPLGPWLSGGVLVDSRGPVLNEDGTRIISSNGGHNTHGSIELINGQWYVFYHRPPRNFGFARQAVVEAVSIQWDEKPVRHGGKVVISAYSPYAENKSTTLKDKQGLEYKGAVVTSEGFHVFGLDPYQFYSAGYACYLSDISLLQDSWDIWDNHMPVTNMKNGNIVGYKYFGFGGLANDTLGLNAFGATKKGNKTVFNMFITPKTHKSFKVNVWIDAPWDNDVWKGKKIAEIVVPANTKQETTQFSIDVARFVEGLNKKHALYLVAEGTQNEALFDFIGLGFSGVKKPIKRHVPPTVSISVNGKPIDMPVVPVRSTNQNGILGYDLYETVVKLPAGTTKTPIVRATANNRTVKIEVSQAGSLKGSALVKCNYNGVIKNYKVLFE